MTPQSKRWLKFAVRWGIAVAGISFVLSNISFRDRVTVLDPVTARPVHAQVLNSAREEDPEFVIVDPAPPGKIHRVSRDDIWVRPPVDRVNVLQPDGSVKPARVLAVKPGIPVPKGRAVREFLIEDRTTKAVSVVPRSQVPGAAKIVSSVPLVEVGVTRMAREAQPWFLLGAILIFPMTYLVTSFRWHLLLGALGVHIGQARTFVLNMVGSFYNSFMPGTTGGDLVKAYYAAKHTTHRTRAVMSVIIDRVIGLLALIILGGAMAAWQYDVPDCRRVALASGLLLAAAATGLVVFYTPTLRRLTGLDFVLKRMPMQRHVHKAVEALDMYGRRPGLMLTALLISLPVHVTTIFSAYMAGRAFNLPLNFSYYWVVVPVIALVGALPVSPQGAGVMEVFAVALTKREGATVSQAFALTMSIRFIQLFWNLLAGLFVLRGGYHAPTESEQETLETDAPEPAPPAGVSA